MMDGLMLSLINVSLVLSSTDDYDDGVFCKNN